MRAIMLGMNVSTRKTEVLSLSRNPFSGKAAIERQYRVAGRDQVPWDGIHE